MPEPALTRPASTTAMMAQRTEPTAPPNAQSHQTIHRVFVTPADAGNVGAADPTAIPALVGAFLAVPVAASLEIAVSRLQAREIWVAEDPAAIETPDEEDIDADRESLPDARDVAGRAVPAAISRAP